MNNLSYNCRKFYISVIVTVSLLVIYHVVDLNSIVMNNSNDLLREVNDNILTPLILSSKLLLIFGGLLYMFVIPFLMLLESFDFIEWKKYTNKQLFINIVLFPINIIISFIIGWNLFIMFSELHSING